MITLCAFIGLPGKSIKYHLKQAEHTLGEIQMSKREVSEKDAVREEITAHEKEEGEMTKYECVLDGHEHPPLPKLKGSYGL